jgi:hypothetical protein
LLLKFPWPRQIFRKGERRTVIIDKSEKKSRTLRDLRQGEVFEFKNSAYKYLYLFVRTGLLFNLATNTDYSYEAWDRSEDNINDREVIVYVTEIHLLDHD